MAAVEEGDLNMFLFMLGKKKKKDQEEEERSIMKLMFYEHILYTNYLSDTYLII